MHRFPFAQPISNADIENFSIYRSSHCLFDQKSKPGIGAIKAFHMLGLKGMQIYYLDALPYTSFDFISFLFIPLNAK